MTQCRICRKAAHPKTLPRKLCLICEETWAREANELYDRIVKLDKKAQICEKLKLPALPCMLHEQVCIDQLYRWVTDLGE